MDTLNISLLNLMLGLLLVAVPALILRHYRTGLVGSLLVSVLRMTLQLFLVGLYLGYLFELDSMWVNVAWLLVMTGICSVDLLRRVRISLKLLLVPVYVSILISLGVVVLYFLAVVLRMDNIFESRYFIPICGIMLGNILSSSIIGINAFYDAMSRREQYYRYMLCNGASQKEATMPFYREAMIKAFNPTIATMAVMGLISLPGTLTGQIIGGSSPDEAIRYQIMILVIVIASSSLSLLMILKWSLRHTLDEYGLLRRDAIR